MVHDVFISYSTKNINEVKEICKEIESEKILCWYAKRNAKPGIYWSKSIIEAIDLSRVVLLVLSKEADNSPEVLREITYASKKEKVIIPYRIDDVVPGTDLNYYLAPIQRIDSDKKGNTKSLKRLIKIISSHLEEIELRLSFKTPKEGTKRIFCRAIVQDRNGDWITWIFSGTQGIDRIRAATELAAIDMDKKILDFNVIKDDGSVDINPELECYFITVMGSEFLENYKKYEHEKINDALKNIERKGSKNTRYVIDSDRQIKWTGDN